MLTSPKTSLHVGLKPNWATQQTVVFADERVRERNVHCLGDKKRRAGGRGLDRRPHGARDRSRVRSLARGEAEGVSANQVVRRRSKKVLAPCRLAVRGRGVGAREEEEQRDGGAR